MSGLKSGLWSCKALAFPLLLHICNFLERKEEKIILAPEKSGSPDPVRSRQFRNPVFLSSLLLLFLFPSIWPISINSLEREMERTDIGRAM